MTYQGLANNNGADGWSQDYCYSSERSYSLYTQSCVGPAFPPEGCAAGSGGFFACPGSDPIANPPKKDDPGQNDGSPSEDPGEPFEALEEKPYETVEATCRRGSGNSASPEGGNPVSAVGDPILIPSGNVYLAEVDYDGAGPKLVRHYNSGERGWIHNHLSRLWQSESTVTAIRPDGKAVVFEEDTPGNWVAGAAVTEHLQRLNPQTPDSAAWQLVTAQDTVELYNAAGRLMSVTYRGGMRLTYQYTGNLLSRVADDFGRALAFAYDANERVTAVTLPDATQVTYEYARHLSKVNYADGTNRQYLYEDARHRHALTGLLDEAGERYGTWTYDAAGRGTSFQHALGTKRSTIEYVDPGVTTTVIDPAGVRRVLQHQKVEGKFVNSANPIPCITCRGDAASRALNASGKVAASTDFKGVQSTYQYDEARKLPTEISAATGLPEARNTTVQWHAELHLPVLVTEQGRSTEYTYDATGKRLTQKVTDLTSGLARTWA